MDMERHEWSQLSPALWKHLLGTETLEYAGHNEGQAQGGVTSPPLDRDFHFLSSAHYRPSCILICHK